MNLYLITARFYGFSERKLFYLAVLWNELTPSPNWVVWLCLCSVCLCSMYKKQLSCCNICVGLFYCAASLRLRITYQNHLVMQCKLHSATKENSENNRKTQPTSHAAFTRDYMIRLRSICGSLCMLFISGEEPTQFITRDVTFVNRKVEEILLVNNR